MPLGIYKSKYCGFKPAAFAKCMGRTDAGPGANQLEPCHGSNSGSGQATPGSMRRTAGSGEAEFYPQVLWKSLWIELWIRV